MFKELDRKRIRILRMNWKGRYLLKSVIVMLLKKMERLLWKMVKRLLKGYMKMYGEAGWRVPEERKKERKKREKRKEGDC